MEAKYCRLLVLVTLVIKNTKESDIQYSERECHVVIMQILI